MFARDGEPGRAAMRSGPPGRGAERSEFVNPRGKQQFPPRHVWTRRLCEFSVTRWLFLLALAPAFSPVLAAPPGAIIENRASLSYVTVQGQPELIESNAVQLTTAVVRSPATVELTRVVPNGSGLYRESVGPAACEQGGSFADLAAPRLVGGTVIDPTLVQELNTSPAYNLSEPIFLRLTDTDQNLDYQVTEYVTVTVSNAVTGDAETIRLTETGPNTGVFSGYVPSVGAAATAGDCRLQAAANSDIRVDYTDPADPTDTARSTAIVDPTQRVFETTTGTVVSGSLVELIDANTGLPATVFGNDGVSQFPSSIISGGSTTDSGGTAYIFAPGEFRFPVVPDGDYRIVVTPPAQFTAPSVVSASVIQNLPGAPYDLSPASFGQTFSKQGGLSFAVDIPVDPNASQLFMQKRTQSTSAAPGDFIRYELTVENSGSAGVASSLRVVDQLPAAMRYVPGSTRINGQTAGDPAIDGESGTLEFSLDALFASERTTISYVVEVVGGKRGDDLVNRATAFAAGGLTSNEATAALRLTEDLFRSTGTLVGRVIEADCTADTFSEEQGVAGVRVYLEDGRYAVSDEGGRFHFEGLEAGTHVAQLDRFTVPEYFNVVGCSDNADHAGRPDSQFVKLNRGGLKQANFFLQRKPAPTGRIELELKSRGGDTAEAVSYELMINGIGNVTIRNIDLMVVLPQGIEFEPGSLRIDGEDLGDPRIMGQAVSMALPDRHGNFSSMLTFNATIDPAVDGDLATKAIATFDTAIESKQRTPVAETRMLREPAVMENAGYVLDLKFDVLSDQLSAGDRAQLDRLIEDWRGVSDVRISAIGHSDSQRIAPRNRHLFADNYALSRARALSAAAYLGASLNVADNGIQVDGRGPDDPLASNATADGRQKNRRVELILSGVRPSKPSFLEVTKAASGTQTAPTIGAIPGSEVVDDSRYRVDPDAGSPKSQVEPGIDTLARGYGFVLPQKGFTPSIPASKVSIKHRPGQKVRLTVNGQAVSPLGFDTVVENADKTIAVSRWRTVALEDGNNRLRAEILNADGSIAKTIRHDVYFAGPPIRAEVLTDRSNLVADGKTKPALAIRLFDRAGEPARPGMTGNFAVRDPYRSWFDVEDSRSNDLIRVGDRRAHYRIGNDGIAFIELAPTTRAGELIVDLEFENQRQQEIRGWLTPVERDWILVGFAEGTAAHRTLSDNLSAAVDAGFEDGYADEGRVAFFAKGQIKGEYLLTLAYDSDRERDKSRFETVVDPNAYYPLYADGSEQRFEAASQRKLYVKLEREQFVALFGDFETGLSVTELARFQRVFNGFKADYRGDAIGYTVFATESDQAFNRDEIRGDGTSGLYRLSRAPIVANSETVRIEVRDRFDTGRVLSTQAMTRFLDYTFDPLNGTLFFKEPVASRDLEFNPVFIVVEYESETSADAELIAGGRISAGSDTLEVGATYITDETRGAESELSGVDLRWQVNPKTLVRAEYASTDSVQGGTSRSGTASKIEIEHNSEVADVRAYIREVEDDFGLGFQSASDSGVRRLGIEGKGKLSESLTLQGEAAWQQKLSTEDIRNLARASLRYDREGFDATIGMTRAEDKFEDGDRRVSDLAEFGISQRFFDNRVRLRVSGSTALGDAAENADYPDTIVVGADIKVRKNVELVTEYETASGENIDASMTRVGLRASPWRRAELMSSVTNEVTEFGPRLFANVGLVQGIKLSDNWLLDVGIDQSNTLSEPGLRQFDDERELASGSLNDDFLAAYVGAMYTSDVWSATSRLEFRNADSEERHSLLFGWYREPQRGHGLSASLTVFDSELISGAEQTAADLKFGWAWRKADSRWSFLDRMDLVYEDAAVDGNASRSWRFINNFNASRRFGAGTQLSLQYAFKYVRDEFDADAFTGYSDLAGFDLRRSLNARWDVGVNASVFNAYESGTRDYSVGADVGFNLATNMWLSLGYNVTGFYDDDFAAARYSAQGPYLRFAIKADQRTLKDIAGMR